MVEWVDVYCKCYEMNGCLVSYFVPTIIHGVFLSQENDSTSNVSRFLYKIFRLIPERRTGRDYLGEPVCLLMSLDSSLGLMISRRLTTTVQIFFTYSALYSKRQIVHRK